MDQAIPRSAGDSASGRAEGISLLHKMLHFVQHFVKKEKMRHAAAGESGVCIWLYAEIGRTAYVLSIAIIDRTYAA